jgi:hypothetical protein
MTDDSNRFQRYVLKRDGEADVRFTGERIAEASSSAERSRGDYSGTTGRWTELSLYRTKGGKYVCHSVGRTQWQGEHDRYATEVCNSEAAVVNYLGHGWLAKELYAEAGIDAAEEIE